jgi:hypothetical protein
MASRLHARLTRAASTDHPHFGTERTRAGRDRITVTRTTAPTRNTAWDTHLAPAGGAR